MGPTWLHLALLSGILTPSLILALPPSHPDHDGTAIDGSDETGLGLPDVYSNPLGVGPGLDWLRATFGLNITVGGGPWPGAPQGPGDPLGVHICIDCTCYRAPTFADIGLIGVGDPDDSVAEVFMHPEV